jgi:hypothetical protein
MELPNASIISRAEADRCRREAKHHIMVKEGNVAIHAVHDPETGVTTIVDHAELIDGKVRRDLR